MKNSVFYLHFGLYGSRNVEKTRVLCIYTIARDLYLAMRAFVSQRAFCLRVSCTLARALCLATRAFISYTLPRYLYLLARAFVSQHVFYVH